MAKHQDMNKAVSLEALGYKFYCKSRNAGRRGSVVMLFLKYNAHIVSETHILSNCDILPIIRQFIYNIIHILLIYILSKGDINLTTN